MRPIGSRRHKSFDVISKESLTTHRLEKAYHKLKPEYFVGEDQEDTKVFKHCTLGHHFQMENTTNR